MYYTLYIICEPPHYLYQKYNKLPSEIVFHNNKIILFY